MRVVVLLILVLVMLSSGCTVPVLNVQIPGIPDIPGFGGTTVVEHEHDVLIIKSMEIVPDVVDAGQVTRVVAYLQNVGDSTLENVEVDLYDYCEGLFIPKLISCPNRAAGSDSLHRQDTTKCVVGEILPNQIVPVTWSVCQNTAAPVTVKTVCPPDGFKMYAEYNYKTSSITTISLIALSVLQQELIERTHKSTGSYIALGQGPIKPVITVEDKQPIPVFNIMPGIDTSSSRTDTDVPNSRTVLKFQVKNYGSGELATETIPKASVKITGLGTDTGLKPYEQQTYTGVGVDDANYMCAFFDRGTTNFKNDLRMIGKESSPYLCTIDLSSLTGKVSKTTTRTVRAEVSYRYRVKASAMITIDPKVAASTVG